MHIQKGTVYFYNLSNMTDIKNFNSRITRKILYKLRTTLEMKNAFTSKIAKD